LRIRQHIGHFVDSGSSPQSPWTTRAIGIAGLLTRISG
jgi:hypothetical protein